MNHKARVFEEHSSACGARTEKCELCQSVVYLRDLAQHEATNCEFKSSFSRPAKLNESGMQCEICREVLPTFDELQVHTLTRHDAGQEHTVPTATQPLPTHEQLSLSGSLESLFMCPVCFTPFQDFALLESHHATHLT